MIIKYLFYLKLLNQQINYNRMTKLDNLFQSFLEQFLKHAYNDSIKLLDAFKIN